MFSETMFYGQKNQRLNLDNIVSQLNMVVVIMVVMGCFLEPWPGHHRKTHELWVLSIGLFGQSKSLYTLNMISMGIKLILTHIHCIWLYLFQLQLQCCAEILSQSGKCLIGNGFSFQYHNDTKHTAHETKAYCHWLATTKHRSQHY